MFQVHFDITQKTTKANLHFFQVGFSLDFLSSYLDDSFRRYQLQSHLYSIVLLHITFSSVYLHFYARELPLFSQYYPLFLLNLLATFQRFPLPLLAHFTFLDCCLC